MRSICGVLLIFGFMTSAWAGNVSVAPTTISLSAPSAASAITLTNSGDTLVKMQARVFAWTQSENGEALQRSTAVAVSPPFVEIRPGASAVVRVVRIAKTPVASEESYRLLLDELPNAPAAKGANVQIVMRHSVPVFFSGTNVAPPQLSLSARQSSGKLNLIVQNKGGSHLKLWNMSAKDSAGRAVSFGNGLNGYVLASGANRFTSDKALKGNKIVITANSNYGPISWATRVE